MVENKFRQVRNPNQTARKQYIEYPGEQGGIGKHKILFDRDMGYHFSCDKSMDKIVEYFVKTLKYELVGEKKGSVASTVKTKPTKGDKE